MGNSEDFLFAAEVATKLPASTTDKDKLKLYGLYKQATAGDVSTARPGMLDMKGKAKWDSWKANEGKDTEAAEKEYIELVSTLKDA